MIVWWPVWLHTAQPVIWWHSIVDCYPSLTIRGLLLRRRSVLSNHLYSLATALVWLYSHQQAVEVCPTSCSAVVTLVHVVIIVVIIVSCVCSECQNWLYIRLKCRQVQSNIPHMLIFSLFFECWLFMPFPSEIFGLL